MTGPRRRLDELDAAWTPPSRPDGPCGWCLADDSEWCISDCGSPDRRCCPEYVAAYAAENGASTDADAALIVAAVNALPDLLRLAREREALRTAVHGLADELDEVADTLRETARKSAFPLLAEQAVEESDRYRECAARLRAVVAATIGGETAPSPTTEKASTPR